MSFFERLAHQISAKAENASRQALSVSMIRAGDVDEYLESIRGYHARIMQIEKGQFVAKAVQTQLAGVVFIATQYKRAVVRSGEPPGGKITFAVGMSDVPALCQGARFEPQDLLFLPPGSEFDIVSVAGHSIAAVSFPVELVRETASMLGLGAAGSAPTSLVVGLQRNEADSVRAMFDAFFNETAARPFNQRAASWALIKQDELLRVLLRCVNNTAPASKSISNSERARVLKAALAAINDSSDDVLGVGDLCRVARSSERTLDYAFTERFGLSPAQYMKARRLNGARNDLCRQHEPVVKIAEIANKWGFWHLGQFAKDYHTWFGELPSETYERRQPARRGHFK